MVDENIIRTALNKVNMKVKSKEIIALIMARYDMIDK